jgi:hypothetical protein
VTLAVGSGLGAGPGVAHPAANSGNSNTVARIRM